MASTPPMSTRWIDDLHGVVGAVDADAFEGATFAEGDLDGLRFDDAALVGVEDGGTDFAEGACAADVGEVGSGETAFAGDQVAGGAAAFAPEDLLAGFDVAGDVGFDGGRGEGADEGDDLPDFVVRAVEGWHVGAGDAFLDDVEHRVVFHGMPGAAFAQVGSAAAVAGGAVASGAGSEEELLSGGDGFGVADGGVLRLVFAFVFVLGREHHSKGEEQRTGTHIGVLTIMLQPGGNR
jgi:hypothetical protein